MVRQQTKTRNRKSKRTPGFQSQESSARAPTNLLNRLDHAISSHSITETINILDQLEKNNITLTPNETAHRLKCLAEWIDYDPSYYDRTKKDLERFRQQTTERSSLTLLAGAHLAIAEGLIEFHREVYGHANYFFIKAASFAKEIRDIDLLSACHHCISRCHRKYGNYAQAIKSNRTAQRYAKLSQLSGLVVRPLVLEAWLRFLVQDFDKSRAIIEQARSKLSNTDDHINKANLISIEGRLTQSESADSVEESDHFDEAIDYFNKAIDYFDEAIKEYRLHPSTHPNIGRTYVNIALVRWLKAKMLGDKAQEKRKVREEANTLYKEALSDLEQADGIYEQTSKTSTKGQHRDLGRLRNVRAFVYYSLSKYDGAESEAKAAYDLGKKKNDHLVMARARITLTMIELERGGFDNVLSAFDLATEALTLAHRTDSRHLQAKAYIYLARVMLERQFGNYTEALQYLQNASDLLSTYPKNDYLWHDFNSLKEDLDKKSGPDRIIVSLTPSDLKSKSLKLIQAEVSVNVVKYFSDLYKGNVEKIAEVLHTGREQVRNHLSGESINIAQTALDTAQRRASKQHPPHRIRKPKKTLRRGRDT